MADLNAHLKKTIKETTNNQGNTVTLTRHLPDNDYSVIVRTPKGKIHFCQMGICYSEAQETFDERLK